MAFRNPYSKFRIPDGVGDGLQSLFNLTKPHMPACLDSKPVLKTDLKKNSLKIEIEFYRKLYTNETNPAAPLWTALKRSNRNNNLDAMA